MSTVALSTLSHIRSVAEKTGNFNLKLSFAQFDSDASGSISHEELKSVLLSLDPHLAYDQILDVIDLFDPNNDGEIQYSEFAHTFHNCENASNRDGGGGKATNVMAKIKRMASSTKGFNLKDAFVKFDKDGDGCVSREELKIVVNDILKGDVSIDEMTSVIELFDKDGDGEIKYAEFRDVFNSMNTTLLGKVRTPIELVKYGLTDADVETKIMPGLMRDEYNELNLQGNELTDSSALEISYALSNDKVQVEKLNLSSNKIKVLGATALGEAIASNVYLSEINLSHNDILGEGAAKVVESFAPTTAGFSSISILELRHCKIDDLNAVLISKSFYNNTSLRKLSLCGNFIGCKGAVALSDVIRNERCAIESINLSNNAILGVGGKALGHSLRMNNGVKEFIISGNRIGDVGAAAFADSLVGVIFEDEDGDGGGDGGGRDSKEKEEREKKEEEEGNKANLCGVRVLGLAGCWITDVGMFELGKALRSNGVLSTFDIRCNNVTDDGIVSISRALEENTCLRELFCGDNKFAAAGAMALGTALNKNVSLLVCDVAGCDLSKNNAAGLADGLLKNESLCMLNIARCKLTDEGCNKFILALQSNQCVESIIFHNNPLSMKVIAALNVTLTRERKNEASMLDDMEAARLERRREVYERGVAMKIDSKEDKDGDASGPAKHEQNLTLDPGETIWVGAAFGRKTNVVGKIEVDSSTSLAKAREKINMLGDLGDDFAFMSVNDGKPIEADEESKRQVIYECGRNVLLRPRNWIVVL